MRFTVLGSGTGIPDPDRGPAGFLVEHGGHAFLVDGGSGTVQRCARAGVDPKTLDGGVYSHFHPDHCADLVPLLFSMRIGTPRRSRDYPVWAGSGFGVFLAGLQSVYGKWIRPGAGEVTLHELSLDHPTRTDLADGLVLATAPAAHTAAALHLRFEAEGHSVTFSGDTAWSEALCVLAAGTDLLVCECGGADDAPVEGHLCPSEVRRLVETARPREVWLTHFYPAVDPVRALEIVAAAGVPVRRAADLDTWSGPG